MTLPGFDWLVALLDDVASSTEAGFRHELILFRKAWLTLRGVIDDVAAGCPTDRVLLGAGPAASDCRAAVAHHRAARFATLRLPPVQRRSGRAMDVGVTRAGPVLARCGCIEAQTSGLRKRLRRFSGPSPLMPIPGGLYWVGYLVADVARGAVFESVGRAIAAYLLEPIGRPGGCREDALLVADTLRPGDVLLVEGNTRMSAAVKYLTQSMWSHASSVCRPRARNCRLSEERRPH